MDGEHKPLTPEEYKKLEGITPEVEKIKEDLPAAEVDFGDLAHQLENMDLQYYHSPILDPESTLLPPEVDEDPDVKLGHAYVEKSFADHDRDLIQSMKREKLSSLKDSMVILITSFKNKMEILQRRYQTSTDPEHQSRLAKALALQKEAEAAIVPVVPAKTQFAEGQMDEKVFYEILMLARNEVRQLQKKLDVIYAL